MHLTTLLIAALVMLRLPSSRNKATASLLLARAAEHTELSATERETCLSLIEEMEVDTHIQSCA